MPRHKLRRGIFRPRGAIPGVGVPDDETVGERDKPGLAAHKARMRGRVVRSAAQHAQDADMRALGVPVYDRNAAMSDLGSITGRRS